VKRENSLQKRVSTSKRQAALDKKPQSPGSEVPPTLPNKSFTEMCSSSEAGSYSRHLTLGLRGIQKKNTATLPSLPKRVSTSKHKKPLSPGSEVPPLLLLLYSRYRS